MKICGSSVPFHVRSVPPSRCAGNAAALLPPIPASPAPLLFIPFVENAVKHSFDSEHSSYVHVFFKVEAHRLEFRCENSKPAVAVQQGKVGGIGLANIQRRLGLLYPEHYKLEQREDENLYSVILSITL